MVTMTTNGCNIPTPVQIVKDLRVKVDSCIQETELLKNTERFEFKDAKREAALAYTKLQEAKMWLGKVLEQMGNVFPEEFRDNAN